MVKDQMLFPKNGNKTRMSALTAFIQHKAGNLSQFNNIRKRNKRHIEKREDIKNPPFVDDTDI